MRAELEPLSDDEETEAEPAHRRRTGPARFDRRHEEREYDSSFSAGRE
jgi:hypothetical protein